MTAVIAAGGVLILVAVFKAMWRVAEPNQALLISGAKHRVDGVDEGMGFRIVTGRGTFVIPGVQVVRKLSLDLNEADLAVDCVTAQGIPVHVKGVVIFKVGDDRVSIANAARRFLDQQNAMNTRVHNILAGHLRSIVGSLTVEEMIRDRERLTEQTRATSGHEMEKLGLTIDSLQIQEIDDPTGYIKALAAPHTAAVQRDARIARPRPNARPPRPRPRPTRARPRRSATPTSSRPATRPRWTTRRRARRWPDRWPRRTRGRRSSCRRPRSPSSRPTSASSSSRSTCASRPTPRRT